VARFAEMMTGRTGDRDLEAWLTAIEADDGQPDLRSFAAGIRNDQQAVVNSLTLTHSSGTDDPRVSGLPKAGVRQHRPPEPGRHCVIAGTCVAAVRPRHQVRTSAPRQDPCDAAHAGTDRRADRQLSH
jgi:hypothetical protein